jgi:hypothetical protein
VPRGAGPAEGACCAKLCKAVAAERNATKAHERLTDFDIQLSLQKTLPTDEREVLARVFERPEKNSERPFWGKSAFGEPPQFYRVEFCKPWFRVTLAKLNDVRVSGRGHRLVHTHNGTVLVLHMALNLPSAAFRARTALRL